MFFGICAIVALVIVLVIISPSEPRHSRLKR